MHGRYKKIQTDPQGYGTLDSIHQRVQQTSHRQTLTLNSDIMEKLDYSAPQVHIIEIEVEAGFAVSQQEPSPWEDM